MHNTIFLYAYVCVCVLCALRTLWTMFSARPIDSHWSYSWKVLQSYTNMPCVWWRLTGLRLLLVLLPLVVALNDQHVNMSVSDAVTLLWPVTIRRRWNCCRCVHVTCISLRAACRMALCMRHMPNRCISLPFFFIFNARTKREPSLCNPAIVCKHILCVVEALMSNSYGMNSVKLRSLVESPPRSTTHAFRAKYMSNSKFLNSELCHWLCTGNFWRKKQKQNWLKLERKNCQTYFAHWQWIHMYR